jgi:hypothetical protein
MMNNTYFKNRRVIGILVLFVSISMIPVCTSSIVEQTDLAGSSGATNSEWVMQVENSAAYRGESYHEILIYGTWAETIAGYQICMFYDFTKIDIVEVSIEDTIAGQFEWEWVFWDTWEWQWPLAEFLVTVMPYYAPPIPAGSDLILKLIVNITHDAGFGDTALDLGSDGFMGRCAYVRTDAVSFTAEKIDGILTIMRPFANLDCNGELSWTDVAPGATVLGSFTISNIGDPGSLLDWEISDEPAWGNWTFTASSGTELPEGDSITVEVEVVAPDEHNTEFTGEVKIVNSEDNSDYCTIDVSLATPRSQSTIRSLFAIFFEWFFERFSLLDH